MRPTLLAALLVACTADLEPTDETSPVVERELIASDGSREFPAGWWDTRHRLACSFERFGDGVYRCEPRAVTAYELSFDPECGETFSGVIWHPGGFFRVRDADGFYDVDVEFAADAAYRRFSFGACVPFFTAGWTLVAVEPDPPLFAIAEPASSSFETTEGSRLRRSRDDWYDPELDTPCRFATIDDQVRCYPTGLERVESSNLFANPACDNRAAEVIASTASRFVLTSPGQRVLEVGEPYDGPLYARTFAACVETSVTYEVSLATPIGDRFVRGLLLPGY